MRKIVLLSLFFVVLAMVFLVRSRFMANASTPAATLAPTVTQTGRTASIIREPALTTAATLTATPDSFTLLGGTVPNFNHIIMIVLENEYTQNVVGSPQMQNFNALVKKGTLLSNYYAVGHPSLPNYMVLVSGSYQNISEDCTGCFVNAPNLADEIETSGRTWKAYFEGMPSPCFVGSKKPYEQIFNPFIYFDSIRLNQARCVQSVVPLTQLDDDLKSGQLPSFIYIAPNVCNSGHDCSASTADEWLGAMVAKLQQSPALKQDSLLVITFDEGVQKPSPILTQGQVPTLLISSLAQAGYVDSTPYTHYSLLKTILLAWNLKPLGDTQKAGVNAIISPWIDEMGWIYPRELTPSP